MLFSKLDPNANIQMISKIAPYRKKSALRDKEERNHMAFISVLEIKGLEKVKQNYFNQFWLSISQLHKEKKLLNLQDLNGNTPLHLTALKNHV